MISGQVTGSYKGKPVNIYQLINMPADEILNSMKAKEDIIPFNDPPRP